MNAKMRRSNIMCCVVGCNNSYNNTDLNIKFYGFPARWYETDRRQIWINSVRRKLEGSARDTWEPKHFHKICSAHFVGNEKCNNPHSPAYNPSIFPKVYRCTRGSDKCKEDRFKRLLKRSSFNQYPDNEFAASSIKPVQEESTEIKSTQDFSCQVSLPNNAENDSFLFECDFSSNCTDVAVCANIPSPLEAFTNLKTYSNKCVGNNDDIECFGFHGYRSVKSDRQLTSLCGVTFAQFNLILSLLTYAHGNSKLSNENRLMLFLIKMKTGIFNSALGVLFNIHRTSCSRIFTTVLIQLADKMRNYVYWPSRPVVDLTMPKSFKQHYPRCRVIIDCTEMKIQQPKKIDERIYTYSSYKGTFTAKFLIGIAPNGFVSFVSKCYGGRSSDAFITNDCGFLDLLENGDVVLADKGFPGIKCKDDVVMVLPPFVHGGILSPNEVEQTYTIASVRIHVERSIQRIKLHNILQKISRNLFPFIDDIVFMCCALTNLQPPIIREEYNKDEDTDRDYDDDDSDDEED